MQPIKKKRGRPSGHSKTGDQSSPVKRANDGELSSTKNVRTDEKRVPTGRKDSTNVAQTRTMSPMRINPATVPTSIAQNISSEYRPVDQQRLNVAASPNLYYDPRIQAFQGGAASHGHQYLPQQLQLQQQQSFEQSQINNRTGFSWYPAQSMDPASHSPNRQLQRPLTMLGGQTQSTHDVRPETPTPINPLFVPFHQAFLPSRAALEASIPKTIREPDSHIIIAISGAPASGMTTLARLLRAVLTPQESWARHSPRYVMLQQNDFAAKESTLPEVHWSETHTRTVPCEWSEPLAAVGGNLHLDQTGRPVREPEPDLCATVSPLDATLPGLQTVPLDQQSEFIAECRAGKADPIAPFAWKHNIGVDPRLVSLGPNPDSDHYNRWLHGRHNHEEIQHTTFHHTLNKACKEATDWKSLIDPISGLKQGLPHKAMKEWDAGDYFALEISLLWLTEVPDREQSIAILSQFREPFNEMIKLQAEANSAVGFEGTYLRYDMMRPIALVEGTMLFANPTTAGQCKVTELMDLCDLKLFLPLDLPTSLARHFDRTLNQKNFPEAEGGSVQPHEVWNTPGYHRHAKWVQHEKENGWLFSTGDVNTPPGETFPSQACKDTGIWMRSSYNTSMLRTLNWALGCLYTTIAEGESISREAFIKTTNDLMDEFMEQDAFEHDVQEA